MIRKAFRIASTMVVCLCTSLSQAGLTFDQSNVELEAGLLEKELEAVFTFQNTGEQPVTITNMKSSCGCTVPTLEKKTYNPGESGEIRALFTIGGRTGAQRKTVTVSTDDRSTPTHSLTFRTTIPEWFVLEPRILRWFNERGIETKEFTLELPNPELVSVVASPGSSDNFTIEEISSGPDRRTYAITPKILDTRVTEKVSFTLQARVDDNSATREAIIYCLIR